ncbi:uncharacterized, partial [Tachysurus ichikawai]
HGHVVILPFSTLQFHNTELLNDKELGTSPWQQAPVVQRWAGGKKKGVCHVQQETGITTMCSLRRREKQTNSPVLIPVLVFITVTGAQGQYFARYH